MSQNTATQPVESPAISMESRRDKASSRNMLAIYPISAAGIQRYTRKTVVPATRSRCALPPMTKTFSGGPARNGWFPSENPEGALYFSQKHTLVKTVFTDAYMYDQSIHMQITTCLERIFEMIRQSGVDFSANELVLDLRRGDKDQVSCGYYLANDVTRALTWLEEVDLNPLLEEVHGASSMSHIKHEIESQYWLHWELYPNARELTPQLVIELKEILLHASGDSLTSQTSTAPYSSDDLDKMISLVNNMTVKTNTENGTGHSACFFGRLMSTFAHQRFLNFHGQHGARLDRTTTIHDTKKPRLLLGELLSLALFCAPDVHLDALENIWVDNIIGHVPWNKFIGRLNTEWRDFILYGILLLNANVTFLSIPSVDTGDKMRSHARISVYISIASSIGAILAGLLLLRQYRTKVHDTADQALKVVSAHRPQTLAIIFCLPYALLMWGGVSFIVAFLFTCFQPTSIVSLSIMGSAILAIGMLVLWTVWTNWERWEPSYKEVPGYGDIDILKNDSAV